MSADDSNEHTDSDGAGSSKTHGSGDQGESRWPGRGSDDEVLDPNLVDMESPEEVDDGLEAAVANLRDAREEVHEEDVQRRRERRDLELERESEDIPLAVDPTEARDTSDRSDEELLEPGPAHRGRRPQSRGWLAGLVSGSVPPWLTSLVLVVACSAGAATIWLHLDASDHDRSFYASFEDRIVIPIQDLIAGDADRFSTEGITLVIEDLGWEERSGEVTAETRHGTQVQKRYRDGDGGEIQARIYHAGSHADARKLAEEELEERDRVVRFDTRVVEIVPVADTPEERALQIVDRLEQFHDMVAESSEDA